MHFFYLDEAGCTGNDLNNSEQPIFVLGGLSVRDAGWNATKTKLDSIIKDYFAGSIPNNFELHSYELLSPCGEGPFSGHSRERRNQLVKTILNLLSDRSHAIHLYSVDKAKLFSESCGVDMFYDLNIPYLISYDYMITYINWYVKEHLGQTARGLLIIDIKSEFQAHIEKITNTRRFGLPSSQRVKWIAEFSYPVDSFKNPMVQLSDLVVFCTKKFLEIELGYRNNYTISAKQFFAECYSLIHERISRHGIVQRQGRIMPEYNRFLEAIQAKPSPRWRSKYGL